MRHFNEDNVVPSMAHVQKWFNAFSQVINRGCMSDKVGAFVFRQ